jgi:SpoVK/Ycf46/Vps4 family AAA+-type ATPase
VAPCLLIFEDIDKMFLLNEKETFLNEVDGLESENGIMMIATMNNPDWLEGLLAYRPSRFDRKYAFPVPSRSERILFCEQWRRKLDLNEVVEFPEKLSLAIADLTDELSFAQLQKLFANSLLALAQQDGISDESDGERNELTSSEPESNSETVKADSGSSEDSEDSQANCHKVVTHDDDHDDNDNSIAELPPWIEFQREVKLLRRDMKERARSIPLERLVDVKYSRYLDYPPNIHHRVRSPQLEMQHRVANLRISFNGQSTSPSPPFTAI